MRARQAILLTAFAVILMACSEDSVPPPQSAALPITKAMQGPFSPPSNGLLTKEQAALYKEASEAIFQLQTKWVERIEAAQGQQKILILQGYESARDMVCTKIGLRGFAEWQWIDGIALLNPANRQVALDAGVALPAVK